MELLTIILIIIIGILSFLLLKKERVLGINLEDNQKEVKIIENKDYQKNILSLLNYIPEGIIIINKSKEILYNNSSAQKRFETKLNENISSFLRNPDLLISIEKAFNNQKVKDLEIEVRNPSVLRMNISLFYDNNNLFFDEESCMLFIRDLTEFYKFQQLKSDFVANVSHELRTPLQSIKMGLETFNKNSDVKIDKLINDEKKIIFKNPWSKLDNGSKINRLYIFVDEFDKYNLNLEEKNNLKELLKNFILKNKLNKNSDIIYDIDEQKIKEIKILLFDENTRNFSIKLKKTEINKKINKSKTNIEKILKKK